MTDILCRGCKADSGVPVPPPGSGYSVGDYARRTGFVFLPHSEEDSCWLCRPCAELVLERASGITDLAGELYINVVTLRDWLRKRLEAG